MDSLPGEFTSADLLFRLTFGGHILLREPVSVHNGVSEDVGLGGQHSVGDIIEVEEVAKEIGDNAHAFGWAVRVASRS